MPDFKISGIAEVYKFLFEKKLLLDRSRLWGLVSQETNLEAEQNAIWAQYSTNTMDRNYELNAFSQVKKYDSRRVKITRSDLNPDGYFDASFISVPEIDRQYILTGIPIPNQVPYFWQMVVEQKVPIIVKLTPTVHYDREYTYFPKLERMTLPCGKYEVRCIRVDKFDSCDYRILRVKIVSGLNKDKTHEIAVLSLSKWGDERKFPLKEMEKFRKYFIYTSKAEEEGRMEKLRRMFPFLFAQPHSPTSYAPIIQCDLGQMRSASFILLDIVMRMLEQKVKGYYSPEAILVKLREQNNNLKIPHEIMKGIYDCLLGHLRILEPKVKDLDEAIKMHVMRIPQHDSSRRSVKKYILPKQWIVDYKERDRFIKEIMKANKRDSTLLSNEFPEEVVHEEVLPPGFDL